MSDKAYVFVALALTLGGLAMLGPAVAAPNVSGSETVEALRLALVEFKARDNREWLIEPHGHQTPAAVSATFTVALEVAA